MRPVANGCDWLAGSEKPARDIQHLFIEAQIFGRAAAGDNQASIIIRIYLFKIVIDAEIMAALFTIGLVALKIMHCRLDRFAGLFVRANGMHFIAGHLQHLAGNHRFIVFNKVPGQQKNLFHVEILHLVFRRQGRRFKPQRYLRAKAIRF